MSAANSHSTDPWLDLLASIDAEELAERMDEEDFGKTLEHEIQENDYGR